MKFSSWFALSRVVVLLICGTLIVSCSRAPPEPAPEFTLTPSQVTTAPPSPAESAETAPAPSRLRYVAVPPASSCRNGPRAHCCEAEEGHAPPLASCSEENCFTRYSGRDTNRNRQTNLEAVAPWPSSMPRWLAKMLRDWHRRRAQRLSEAAEKQRRALEQLTERAGHHQHRAKHWDLVANRRRE